MILSYKAIKTGTVTAIVPMIELEFIRARCVGMRGVRSSASPVYLIGQRKRGKSRIATIVFVIHTATLCLAEQLKLARHNASTRCVRPIAASRKVMAVQRISV
jgi:hypothetical protein